MLRHAGSVIEIREKFLLVNWGAAILLWNTAPRQAGTSAVIW